MCKLEFKCPECSKIVPAISAKQHYRINHPLKFGQDGYKQILNVHGKISDANLSLKLDKYAIKGPVAVTTKPEPSPVLETPRPPDIPNFPTPPVKPKIKIEPEETPMPEPLNVKEETKTKEPRFKHVECGAQFDDFKDDLYCPDCMARLRDKEV